MKKVLLLLANGYEIFEASVFIDVIGWNEVEGNQQTKLYSCGLKKELTASFGQRSIVDFLVKDLV